MKSDDLDKNHSEGPLLRQLIDKVLGSHAGHHPGIAAEAIVEQIATTYVMAPRETHHRELRKNHQERIRRVAHEVYRILADTQDAEPGREIAARVLRSFLLFRRAPATTAGPTDRQ